MGVSICAVILLVLGLLNNVVGVQTVQSSNQQVIRKEGIQKELVFQTIRDMANNKDIQRIILKSQISKDGFVHLDVKFPVRIMPVLTKNQLKQMFVIGWMLSKLFGRSRMFSVIAQHQVMNQKIQQEISVVIENNATLAAETAQLSSLKCDCEIKELKIWHFPVICIVLLPLRTIAVFASILIEKLTGNFFPLFEYIISDIGYFLGCFWTGYPPYAYVLPQWK
jgi:hypothetical protein